jgi:hypothetical protein
MGSITSGGREGSALSMRAVSRTTFALASMPVLMAAALIHLGQIGAADSGWVTDRVIQTARHLTSMGRPKDRNVLALQRTRVVRHVQLVLPSYSAPSVL